MVRNYVEVKPETLKVDKDASREIMIIAKENNMLRNRITVRVIKTVRVC